ncbi:hypothetical protein G9E11_15370 [Arthrobacter sp. IA7]|uniref:hypothetical protein n=1 Tax=Arthrobacter ipis TaxID=2716202 RepID=UPI0016895382|nr:hypothetical protein [Arthrobacter ipis]MBD1543591.1 hypothetical protein [Arthrobacter ipis]
MFWDALWGPSPQLARLNEAIEDMRSELADTGHDKAAGWYEAAQAHLERATALVRMRQIDAAWEHLYRARERAVMGMSPEAVVFAAKELSAEVEHSGKFSEWRRKAIQDLLQQVVPGGLAPEEKTRVTINPWTPLRRRLSGPSSPLETQRLALRYATHLRNESFATDYRLLRFRRIHMRRLFVLGAISAGAVTALVVSHGANLAQTSAAQVWVLLAACGMGTAGAVISASQRAVLMNSSRIPHLLESHTASLSRVPVGAISGLLVWLGSQVIDGSSSTNAAYLLIAAFAAGFAERLVTTRT